MIGLFKHNNPLAILLLIVLALLPFLGEKGGLDTVVFTTTHPTLVEKELIKLIQWMGSGNSWVSNITAISLLLVEALLLNKLATDHKLVERGGMLPAMSFLLLNALIPVKITGLVLLSNMAMILLLRIMILLYKKNKPNNLLLGAGCIVGMLTALKTPYFTVYIWLMVALLIMRTTSLKDALVATIGFLLPFYFLAAGLYLNDNLVVQHGLSPLVLDLGLPNLRATEVSRIAFFIALPWIGLIAANQHISKMMILNRKTYIVVLLLFPILIASSILDDQQMIPQLHLLLVPGSLMASNLFAYHKKDHVPNLIFLGMVALSLFR